MTKKIVSIVTILSFLLTLVPFAAFAANVTTTVAPAKVYKNIATDVTATVTSDVALDKEVKVKFGADEVVATPDAAKKVFTAVKSVNSAVDVKVQATHDGVNVGNEATITVADVPAVSASASYVETDKTNVEVEGKEEVQINFGLLDADANALPTVVGKTYVWAETTNNQASDALEYVVPNPVVAGLGQEGKFVVANNIPKGDFKVTFKRAGKYTIKAAFVPEGSAWDGTKLADMTAFKLSSKADSRVVTVTGNTSIGGIKIDGSAILKDGDKYNTGIGVNANGLTETVVKVNVVKADGTSIGSGTKVNFDTDSANLRLAKTEATTGYDGSVEAKLTGDVYGTYKLYVTAGDVEVTATNVVVGDSKPAFIEVSKTPAKAFAWDKDFSNGNGMEDFVRFVVKDINGNLMKGVQEGEPAMTNAPGDFIKVLDKPAGMNVEGKDFKLVPTQKAGVTKDYYSLVSKKELKVGKYTVQVALSNGKKVAVTFEIAKFGVAKELKLEYSTETVQLNGSADAPDVFFVDKDGVQKNAGNRVTLGFNGYAVKKFNNDGSFTVKDDEKYLGSKIAVTAVAEREGLTAVANLTVAADGRSIKFKQEGGEVNKNNTVDFQLVDGDGKTVSMGADVVAKNIIIQNTSDDTAKVSATFADTADVKDKGQGTLTLTSNKPATVEFQVYVKDANGKFYAGNLKYTFGDKQSFAGRVVVMTINSNQVIVDNNIVTIDTAAVIKNNRTFVPFRALAESLGAKVDFNDKDQTITASLDGKTLVMTVGKMEYKVGDKEAKLDVAPYVQDNRTMIPVRFAAEALGFKVTPTYNANGTTASVAFTK